jgi:hypothetical protein
MLRLRPGWCLVFGFPANEWFVCHRKLPIDECEQLVLDVAASRIDREQTTRRLRKLAAPSHAHFAGRVKNAD